MFLKRLCMLVVSLGILITFGCATLEKGTDYATSIIPQDVDEKLFSQVPEEKKDAINPLLDAVRDARDHLELSKALVDKKKSELNLEKTKKALADIGLEISEAELNLGKMKAVQSEGLGDARKVNKQVAKLEANVYELKGEKAKQKAKVENAKLGVEEAQKKIEDLESITHK